jgi:ferredoxin
MGARSLQNGRIFYDAGLCKGCGHCVAVCPSNAIRAAVSDLEEAVADVFDRIDRLIEY